MRSRYARHWARAFAVIGGFALLGTGAAAQAEARPPQPPTVEIESLARLAPDARSITVHVLASCPQRWTVVEAVAEVSQPQASGQASFPLTCTGSVQLFSVAVPAAAGTFALAEAEANASVVIRRGRTQSARDSQALRVEPGIDLELANTARLQSGGAAVVIAVAVACPVGTTGRRSVVLVSQGLAIGTGTYTPICDGSRHTFDVNVQASEGVYQPGEAQALASAEIEFAGSVFLAITSSITVQLVA